MLFTGLTLPTRLRLLKLRIAPVCTYQTATSSACQCTTRILVFRVTQKTACKGALTWEACVQQELAAHLLQSLQLLFVLLLSRLPLSLPSIHLRLVVLLQGQVRCVADCQRLLQLGVLGGQRIMLSTLVCDPPAATTQHHPATFYQSAGLALCHIKLLHRRLLQHSAHKLLRLHPDWDSFSR